MKIHEEMVNNNYWITHRSCNDHHTYNKMHNVTVIIYMNATVMNLFYDTVGMYSMPMCIEEMKPTQHSRHAKTI